VATVGTLGITHSSVSPSSCSASHRTVDRQIVSGRNNTGTDHSLFFIFTITDGGKINPFHRPRGREIFSWKERVIISFRLGMGSGYFLLVIGGIRKGLYPYRAGSVGAMLVLSYLLQTGNLI